MCRIPLRALPNCQIKLKARKSRFLPYFCEISGYKQKPQTFAEHLRKRRLDLGLLQREVAEKLGVHVATYRGWETFDAIPIKATMSKVIQFLGYDPSELSARDRD